MPDNQWKVFLDTNVLIAGLVSRTGASAAILDLGEAEEIRIVISRHVLIEADRVFLAKFSPLIDRFRMFIKNLAPLLIDDPQPQAVREAGKVIEPDDAPILAAVKNEDIDYLVTLNTKHFKTAKARAYLSTPILTPGEFLTAFRAFWEKNS
ncbi:MAG: putative toxin-antitoxin system toxin component, PIN family [Candidatus Omnitrophica bacterium]|nr:putative toxin-antitoxin system toxin component, PIN family [Candidatus Omnitrophota bacterium]